MPAGCRGARARIGATRNPHGTARHAGERIGRSATCRWRPTSRSTKTSRSRLTGTKRSDVAQSTARRPSRGAASTAAGRSGRPSSSRPRSPGRCRARRAAAAASSAQSARRNRGGSAAHGRGPGGRERAPGSARSAASKAWNQLSPPLASSRGAGARSGAPGGPGDLAHEGGAPSGQLDAPAERQVGAGRTTGNGPSPSAVTAALPTPRILGKSPDASSDALPIRVPESDAWPIIRCGTTSTSSAASSGARNPHEELRLDAGQRSRLLGRRGCGASPATPTCRPSSKDPATFSNAGGIRPDSGPIPMMIDMDDPQHWPRRKLVNRGFTPRRVREQRGRRSARACDEIIDAVCERGECDFVQRHRRLAADDHDRRRARRRRPRTGPMLLEWSDDMLSRAHRRPRRRASRAADAFVGYTEYATGVDRRPPGRAARTT